MHVKTRCRVWLFAIYLHLPLLLQRREQQTKFEEQAAPICKQVMVCVACEGRVFANAKVGRGVGARVGAIIVGTGVGTRVGKGVGASVGGLVGTGVGARVGF